MFFLKNGLFYRSFPRMFSEFLKASFENVNRYFLPIVVRSDFVFMKESNSFILDILH